jgi:queuine tRNA-ribosyltransferase
VSARSVADARAPRGLDCEVVLTRSGARAMLDKNSGEIMHPVVGPLTEAERLYVGPSRLAERLKESTSAMSAPRAEPLVLFDVGLGAGSNAAAALRVSESLPETARRLHIVSFDLSLQALELALQPAHAAAFGLDGAAGCAARALLSRGHHDSPRTSWRLSAGDVRTTLTREPALSADVVFWDPFSPGSNPELWTLQAFAALRCVCRAAATVHTYSGATAVRSALLLAGFCVGIGERIAEGKYGTQAALDRRALHQPLDQRWLARLARSSAPFPKDAPADAIERIRAMPQFV